jgi:NTP pyrophosphatase (non-canonical NTP hydrolase)
MENNDFLKDEIQMYRERQQRIFDNKVNHGFNTTNVYQEARYILEETAELMRAIEKNDKENLKEELADIVIFAYGCAAVAGVGNLDEEIFKKMAINEKRIYEQNTEGDFEKVNESKVV